MGIFDLFRSTSPTAALKADQRATRLIDEGNVIEREGLLDAAMQRYLAALAASPKLARAHLNYGNILLKKGDADGALRAFDCAIELDPEYAAPHYNKGNVLHDLRRFDAAVASYHRALEIRPDLAVAHYNLGIALTDLRRFDESIASFRRAMEIEPGFSDPQTHLLFALTHLETSNAASLFAEHCNFSERFEIPLRAHWPEHTNSRDGERRIHIGFVSGDLHAHAVTHFLEPVLANLHGSPTLTLHAYYNNTVEDSVTSRLRGYFAQWNTVSALSDEVLAKKIVADGIDILIDLSGHTGHNRLLTFARKPAPIQVTWIGHPSTTGLRAMDYFLTDRYLTPPDQLDNQFTEKLAYLPAVAPFQLFAPLPPLNPLPAIINGYLTFGSFHKLSKLSPSVIAQWAMLLRALPDSRLLLGGMPEAGELNPVKDWLAREGITHDRLSFSPRSPLQAYLEQHHQIDICLDTFPFSGYTVSHLALLMGVPTLTLSGRSAAARQGEVVLSQVGLASFVASDAEDFVRKGQTWAANLPALAELRAGMRERIAQAPGRQSNLIAGSLERALRIMWRRWCAGLSAVPFSTDPSLHELWVEDHHEERP